MNTLVCDQFLYGHRRNSLREVVSYLDPLQGGGRLGDALWHIKALGGADLGVDQPLLEVSQGCAEPLLQQALLVLTLPGRTEAEAGSGETYITFTGWKRAGEMNKERTMATRCLLPMCSSKQRHVSRYCTY